MSVANAGPSVLRIHITAHWEYTLFRRIKHTHTQDILHNCSAESKSGLMCVYIWLCVCATLSITAICITYQPQGGKEKRLLALERKWRRNEKETTSHIFHWVATQLRRRDTSCTIQAGHECWKSHQPISGRRYKQRMQDSAMFQHKLLLFSKTTSGTPQSIRHNRLQLRRRKLTTASSLQSREEDHSK